MKSVPFSLELLVFCIVLCCAVILLLFFKRRKVDFVFPEIDYEKQLSSRVKGKAKGKYEEECRRILESMFNVPFPSIRPDWLKNPETKRNLELDCYNADLRLALEYDGRQHAEYVPHFHKNKQAFRDQVTRDIMKEGMCRKLGITLIRVPHYVKFEDLYPYISSELRKRSR